MEESFKLNNTILISVVMPVYNVQIYLEEAIQSVLNQSLKEIELVLVNDGSTDESSIICDKFSQIDSRIEVIHQKNSGVSIARNNGLVKAKGEYIYFMDSDDTIDEFFLETSLKNAKKNNSSIVVIGEYYKSRFPDPTAFPTCAIMIKKEFLDKYPDVRFPENIQPCEDGLFSHQLLALTKKVSFNSLGIYHYRKHENQNTKIINENVSKTLNQIPFWLKILEDFYAKYDLFKSHSLHLAKFIEHEPFEFRFLSMPLSEVQKVKLFELIQNFYYQRVNNHITKQEKLELSEIFNLFITSETLFLFRKRLKYFFIKWKIFLFFSKFIPFSSSRRNLRKKAKSNIQFINTKL